MGLQDRVVRWEAFPSSGTHTGQVDRGGTLDTVAPDGIPCGDVGTFLQEFLRLLDTDDGSSGEGQVRLCVEVLHLPATWGQEKQLPAAALLGIPGGSVGCRYVQASGQQETLVGWAPIRTLHWERQSYRDEARQGQLLVLQWCCFLRSLPILCRYHRSSANAPLLIHRIAAQFRYTSCCLQARILEPSFPTYSSNKTWIDVESRGGNMIDMSSAIV
jgi:hypothetical protein